MGTHNNMIKVDGVKIKTPSVFSWGLQDVSASNAGRTQDARMHKNRIAQKRKIDLAWAMPTPEEAGDILNAFDPEYVNVTYYDPKDRKVVTRNFYTGDKTAPVKIWTVGNKRYESVSFNIIER
ncbi:MAG: hypothetical protein Q4F83_04935 [Eubacteriales bacterium]|nr:hypothetical protein [Eubacteriales bacterium]